MNRCLWCNLKNEKYVIYHDNEWGCISHDDGYLFELLLLESFQVGLSWETILNKRENFRFSFDNFDYKKICLYNKEKVEELMKNKNIVRNRLKIESTINNAKIFIEIQKEYGSFDKYIWSFTNNKVINYKTKRVSSELSDKVSDDLKKRGMKFVGTKIIYSYLQAIGVINGHEENCFLYNNK